jgi:hypothetical protein
MEFSAEAPLGYPFHVLKAVVAKMRAPSVLELMFGPLTNVKRGLHCHRNFITRILSRAVSDNASTSVILG